MLQLVDSSLNVICPSVCFYKLILHPDLSKFDLERSPVNSFNLYANFKKANNEQNMAHNACISIFFISVIQQL